MEIRDGDHELEESDDESAMHFEWRRHEKPDNEMPGSVAVDALLGSTANLAVFVSGMRAFRNGIEFTLHARARTVLSKDSRTEWLCEGISGLRNQADRLLLGIEFADGRRCTNLRGHYGSADNSPDQLHLSTGDGSGSGDDSAEFDYFLSPLPPPGYLRIVCAWPARGIPETITELTTEDILQAASRARELWPWQPPEVGTRKPTPPALPPLPEGGWFAQLAAEVEGPPDN
jgi:hypothetical protein